MHCRVFSSILGLYPLDSSSIAHPPPPTKNCDNQKCLQTFLNVPQGAKSPLVENHSISNNLVCWLSFCLLLFL